ncbi:MAG: hypothetical protein IT379_30400 [Deltaproteobacteria bacterium]|nr:hypothetical protein [Deltaproteobacteria bacterium]
MTPQELFASIAGVGFLALLLGIGVFILVRGEKPVPREAMFIFRVILALAGAGFAAVLPGFLELDGTVVDISLRAGGALATFAILYLVNPPERVERKVAGPRKPVKRKVSRQSIEPELPPSETDT